MCIHTPADNHVADYLQKLFDSKRPKKLSHVTGLLKRIPEYADGLKKGSGPRILIGDPGKDAGKVFVDMTGGTEGPKRVYARLSQAGVGTVVGMHLSDEHFKYAKEEQISVVIAGHIASDTLGLNLLLDEIEKKGELDIIPCSGFVRIRR
jgi:putative NIF3 family GTP cyclohydrolase 1 type 2